MGFSCYDDKVLVMPFKTGRVWFDSQMKVQLSALGRRGLEVKAAVVLATPLPPLSANREMRTGAQHTLYFFFFHSVQDVYIPHLNISVNILTDTPRSMSPR